MDENLYEDMVDVIKQKSLNVKGLIDTEKCFVRKNGMYFLIDIHAIVPAEFTVKEGHDIAHNLKDYLMAEMPEISNVFVHIEPFNSLVYEERANNI